MMGGTDHDPAERRRDVNSPTTTIELTAELKSDRPGELAKAVTAIANMDVNIEGYCEIDGRFHVVTSDPNDARKALEMVGFTVTETEIVIIETEDRPGALANILRRISAEELNVVHSYTLTKTRVAITVDQPERLRDVLHDLSPAATRLR
jgi:hypothetical protein